MELISTGGNFLLILFGFGFLIFVHELGHFLAARWANIRVDCFAIGMGPPVLSWRSGIGFRVGSTDRVLVERYKKTGSMMSEYELSAHGLGETEYTLRLLPIGGYVRMVGQEDGNPSAVSDSPRSYQTCPIGKRMVVVSAGVIMNLITAVMLFWVAFTVGVRFPAAIVGVGVAIPGSPAALAVATNASEAGLPADAPAGLQPGDRVIAVDGAPADTFADIVIAGAMSRPAAGDRTLGTPIELRVQRPGIATPLEFSVQPKLDKGDGLLKIGVGGGPALSPRITAVKESHEDVVGVLKSAGLAALTPGATLRSVEGTEVSTLDEFEWRVATGDGSPVSTTWDVPDAAAPVTLSLTPQAVLQTMPVSSGSETVAVSGLFGLTPLIRIEGAVEGGVNDGRFQAGDVVLRVGDVDAPNFADLRRVAKDAQTRRDLNVVVLRDGVTVPVAAKVNKLGKLDVHVSWATELPRIAQPIRATVATDSTSRVNADATPDTSPDEIATPVADLGLFGGSTITDVAGVTVSDWTSIRAALRSATAKAYAAGEGSSVEFGLTLPLIEKSKDTKTLTLSAEQVKALHGLRWRSPIPPTIFDPSYVTLKATGPMHATAMGFHETKKLVLQVYLTLDRLVRGSIGVDKLNGPVGIFHLGVQVADQGFMFLVFFVAMLSVNLAVMNFLPLPIVDGGLFLFLIYEKLVGKPPSIGFQNAATAVGLILIGSIFLITFYNDVVRLIG